MANQFEATLKKECSFEGVGLHTGEKSRVLLKPSEDGSGFIFFKNSRQVAFKTSPESSGNRCTQIGEGEDEVLTVEHLLASLVGLGITNARIEVEGPEMPGLDGSAQGFVKGIQKGGICEQKKKKKFLTIPEPFFVSEPGKALLVLPAEDFSVSYCLDYPWPGLRAQTVSFQVRPDIFETEIAPARTFCTKDDAVKLKAAGFGKGANTQNTLVIGKNGPHENKLRFPDECARHKVLDLIGDLALLNRPLQLKVVGIRSGHALNHQAVEALKKLIKD